MRSSASKSASIAGAWVMSWADPPVKYKRREQRIYYIDRFSAASPGATRLRRLPALFCAPTAHGCVYHSAVDHHIFHVCRLSEVCHHPCLAPACKPLVDRIPIVVLARQQCLPLHVIHNTASTKRQQFASCPTYAHESSHKKSRIFVHWSFESVTCVM